MEQSGGLSSIEYEQLPIYPSERLGIKKRPYKGERTEALDRLVPIVRLFADESNPDFLSPQDIYRAMLRMPPDTEIFHGGDSHYIGNFWSYDVLTALSFCHTGSQGEKRKYPTLRVMTVKDLLGFINECHKKSEHKNMSILATFMKIVGGGNDWRDLEIDFRGLIRGKRIPIIKSYRPPESLEF